MTTTGWIKYYRQSLKNNIYFCEPFDKWHAWMDILLSVDRETGKMMFTANGLADRWKWSRGKVLRFLSELAENGMVTLDGTIRGQHGGTFLSVVKWGFYQGAQTLGGTLHRTLDDTFDWGKGDIDTVGYREEKKNNNTPLESIINNTFSSPTEGRSNTAEAGLTECVSQAEKRPSLASIERELTKEFEEVWKLYPRKIGKPNALRDYIKARNSGIEKQTILDGLNAYNEYIKANGTEERYIKMGATWFHQHSWEDDYSGRPSANTKNGRPLSRREREELELEEWFKNHE